MIDLSGRVALITGGGRGIGKAISLKLAKAGAKICFTNRNLEVAKETEAEIKSLGGDCFSFIGDITDSQKCEEAVKEVIEKYGKIDILVNNAGITQDSLVMRMNQEAWQSVIDTNLTGTFNMVKAVIKAMMKNRYGRIINISSIVGFTGNPGQVNYSTTKAGLIGMTKSLAKEVASRNITCNAIAPGFIKTDMTDQLQDDQQENLLKNIPLGRMGVPDDIANGVLYLSSPLADYVTGTVLHINGGMY